MKAKLKNDHLLNLKPDNLKKKKLRAITRPTMFANSSSPILTLLVFTAFAFYTTASLHAPDTGIEGNSRRVLLSFRETSSGNNKTYDCSPSGPCVPCQYSEKNDEKYRCSETGYRIPLKCVEIKGPKDPKPKLSRRSALEIFPRNLKLHTVLRNFQELAMSLGHRRFLSDSTKQEDSKEQVYITYRSCIQTVSEEKLSVIGFEGIVFCALLVSGYFVYSRKKQSVAPSGFARIQTNSRF